MSEYAHLALERQEGIFEARVFGKTPFHVIGGGSVGGEIAMLAAHHGIENIHVWDKKHVSEHNPHNQPVTPDEIGWPKVDALKHEIFRKTGVSINTHYQFVKGREPLAGAVMLCPDDMDERWNIGETCLWGNSDVLYASDQRMDGTYIINYALNPSRKEHCDRWKSLWHPQSESQIQVAGCGSPLSVLATARYLASSAFWQFILWHGNKTGLYPETKPYFLLAEDMVTRKRITIDWDFE